MCVGLWGRAVQVVEEGTEMRGKLHLGLLPSCSLSHSPSSSLGRV